MTLRRSLAAPALLSLLAFACERAPDPPSDPYLAELRARLEALRPEVEREIGRKLRKVELVVLPREKIVEQRIPRLRAALSRIENGPRGEDLEAEARATAEGTAEWALAHVDPEGRIVFPDPADPESLFRLVLGLLPRSDFAKDPRAPDLILLHELVHVHQHWHLETPAFHASARSRADILARRAVLEGHAEHLTRRIATRIGLGDLYEKYLARSEPPAKAKEFLKAEHRVSAADVYFAYAQGERFVAEVVRRLGYDEAVRRIFKSPPTLAAVSRPELYFEGSEPSRWDPVAEDLRRWLARERGQANLEPIAVPMVREMAGEAAGGFREGFSLNVGLADVNASVLVARDEAAARELHAAWTRTLERMREGWREAGLSDDMRLSRKPDDWTLAIDGLAGHMRQNVVRERNLVIDVLCFDDSELEQGAERLARRAVRFLTDASWREAWLKGDRALLEGEDSGLKLGVVSRLKRFVPDEDWEVRWLGRFHEARDVSKDKEGRIAVLTAAIEDPESAVVARGLRALVDLRLYKIPSTLLRERLGHPEAAVRRAAWDLVDMSLGDDPEWDLPPEEALALVAAALDDTDVTVRREAADCLSEFHDEPGLPGAFRKALTDEQRWVRQEALICLSNCDFQFPELLPEITELLDEHPGVASEALGKLGPAAEPALPRLREILEGTEGRADAAEAIWRITDDPEPLLAVVRESVAEGTPVGIDAVGGMGAIARPAVPDVAKVLAHDNRWVRITAAKTLGKIGGPEAREALTRRLEIERDPKALEAIRKALAEIRE